jgi:hypothetical protein
MCLMVAVTRLVTLVEVRDDVPDARQMSVSARHEAVLADGRRLLLLGDRGWVSSLRIAMWEEDGALGGGSGQEDGPDIWATTSVEDIENTARAVVGPDEPFGERSQEDMEADHWAYLTGVLRQQGVIVDAVELKRLPHDVELGPRLLARIARGLR